MTALSVLVDYCGIPYSLAISVAAMVLAYFAFVRKRLLNLLIDVLMAVGVFAMTQVVITVGAGMVYGDILDSHYILIALLSVICVVSALLSANKRLGRLLEKHYRPNRQVVLWMAVAVVCLLAIVVNFANSQTEAFSRAGKYILVVAIAYLAVNAVLTVSLIRAKSEKSKYKMLMEYGRYLEDVTDELRRMAHEHKGHLQMVIGIAEASRDKKTEECLKDYIGGIFEQNMSKYDTSIIRDNPLVSAFLYNSGKMADKFSIMLDIHISNTLAEYPIPGHDLVEILMNLVNNAFEEVVLLPLPQREVFVEFRENTIEISNRTTPTTQNTDCDMFTEKGFSTKGKDRGLGIVNVMALAERHGVRFDNFLSGEYYVSILAFNKQGAS